MRNAQGRLHPKAIAGPKAKVGDALVWTGTEWKPKAPSASGLAIVDDDEPASPPTGQLWYDPDDDC